MKAGDTLALIAARYGTTYQELAQINHIPDPNLIFVNQVISLSAQPAPAPAPAPAPVVTTAAPKAVDGLYTVKAGDTLYNIAVANDTTVANLVAVNSLPSANSIQVGQVLHMWATPAPTPTPAASATPAPAAVVTAAVPKAVDGLYTVKAGDTLYNIAVANDTTVANLVAVNSLPSANSIQVGQVLHMWATPAPTPTPTPAPVAAAPVQTAAAPVVTSPKAVDGSYTVKAGDTLSSIAAANGMTVSQLMADNNLSDANSVQVGQVLHTYATPAPTPAATPAPAPTPTPAASTPAAAPTAPAANSAPASASASPPSSSLEACVIRTESGGNAQAVNPSGHWGLFQFSKSTWVAYGGSPSAFGNASAAEQEQVFANAIADGGASNWTLYDGC